MRSASEVRRRRAKTSRPNAPRGGADGDRTAAEKDGCGIGVEGPSLTKTGDETARSPTAADCWSMDTKRFCYSSTLDSRIYGEPARAGLHQLSRGQRKPSAAEAVNTKQNIRQNVRRSRRPGPGPARAGRGSCDEPPTKLKLRAGGPEAEGPGRPRRQGPARATPSGCRRRRRRAACPPCRAALTSAMCRQRPARTRRAYGGALRCRAASRPLHGP